MNSDLVTDQQLSLSAERLAMLAPKLRALLADFSQLQALASAELEPVSTDWLVREYADDHR